MRETIAYGLKSYNRATTALALATRSPLPVERPVRLRPSWIGIGLWVAAVLLGVLVVQVPHSRAFFSPLLMVDLVAIAQRVQVRIHDERS